MKKVTGLALMALALTACTPTAPAAETPATADAYCEIVEAGASIPGDVVKTLTTGRTALPEQVDAISELARLLRENAPTDALKTSALSLTRLADTLEGGRTPSADEEQEALAAISQAKSHCN